MARKPRTTKKSTASKTVAKKTEPVEKKVSRVEFKAKPVTGAKVKLQPIAGSQVKIPGVPFAFSGRIVEAYYTNPELDTIEIMWSDGEKNRSYYLKVDENDDQFKALLSEYSYENFKAVLCFNNSINELEILSVNAKNIITCNGPVTHLGNAFSVNVVDIIEKKLEHWYNRHISNTENYNKLYRKNFNDLSVEILNKIK